MTWRMVERWRGKLLTEMSQEELIGVIQSLADQLEMQRENHSQVLSAIKELHA